MEIWHIWIFLAVGLFIVEIFTPTFLAICLALGCITSGIFSYFDYDFKVQLIAFSTGALIGFFGVRPFMLKYAYRNSKNIKTNTEALVGRVGRVEITIDNLQNCGSVIIDGDHWRAETENNEIIKQGEKAQVLRVSSNIIIVKPITIH